MLSKHYRGREIPADPQDASSDDVQILLSWSAIDLLALIAGGGLYGASTKYMVSGNSGLVPVSTLTLLMI